MLKGKSWKIEAYIIAQKSEPCPAATGKRQCEAHTSACDGGNIV